MLLLAQLMLLQRLFPKMARPFGLHEEVLLVVHLLPQPPIAIGLQKALSKLVQPALRKVAHLALSEQAGAA